MLILVEDDGGEYDDDGVAGDAGDDDLAAKWSSDTCRARLLINQGAAWVEAQLNMIGMMMSRRMTMKIVYVYNANVPNGW